MSYFSNYKIGIFMANGNGLEQRYFNDLEQELKIGIDNVMKICELRVRDLVQVAQQKEPSRL